MQNKREYQNMVHYYMENWPWDNGDSGYETGPDIGSWEYLIDKDTLTGLRVCAIIQVSCHIETSS